MRLEDVYGTRAYRLPKSMVRVVRADGNSDRLLMWVGRPGIELLSLDQHLLYEHEIIGRYPRNSDGSIDWSSVAEGLILGSTESDIIEFGAVVPQFVSDSVSLVFMWGSLDIPSVKMTLGAFLSSLSDMPRSIMDFWIYSPDERVVVEYSFDGALTAARLPPDARSATSSDASPTKPNTTS